MTADLVRVEVPVRWADRAPATHPGRALNAWFYGLVAGRDERLATELHERPGPKPFTVALVPSRDEPSAALLVVTGCGPLAAYAEAAGSETSRLLLDGRWLERAGGPAVRSDTWGGLASRRLVGLERAAAVRLEFLTPTTFHSKGRTLPLPVPELVFGGLLQRWQAWSSVDLGDGAATTIAERAALRRHRLWTVMTQMEGKHTGCLGWADFLLLRPEPAYGGLLALLGGFAEYAGVGQKTSMGFGCVRVSLLGGEAAREGRATATGETKERGRTRWPAPGSP